MKTFTDSRPSQPPVGSQPSWTAESSPARRQAPRSTATESESLLDEDWDALLDELAADIGDIWSTYDDGAPLF